VNGRMRILSAVQQGTIQADDPRIIPPLTQGEKEWIKLGVAIERTVTGIEYRTGYDYDPVARTCTPTDGTMPFGQCFACGASLYLQGTPGGDYCKCPNGCPDPYWFDKRRMPMNDALDPKADITVGKIRSALYLTARILGDVNAVRRGKIAQRVRNRILGRLLWRLFRGRCGY
jgi:hypothetical protein